MEKTFHLVLYRSPGEVFYTLPQMKFFDDAHVGHENNVIQMLTIA